MPEPFFSSLLDYANPNIRGVFVANDDTAAVVTTGFWEEALDFRWR